MLLVLGVLGWMLRGCLPDSPPDGFIDVSDRIADLATHSRAARVKDPWRIRVFMNPDTLQPDALDVPWRNPRGASEMVPMRLQINGKAFDIDVDVSRFYESWQQVKSGPWLTRSNDDPSGFPHLLGHKWREEGFGRVNTDRSPVPAEGTCSLKTRSCSLNFTFMTRRNAPVILDIEELLLFRIRLPIEGTGDQPDMQDWIDIASQIQSAFFAYKTVWPFRVMVDGL